MSSIPVSSNDNLGVGAVGRRFIEEPLHLSDTAQVGTPGEEVCGQQGRIVDALGNDIGDALCGLDAIGGRGANGRAHVADLCRSTGEEEDDGPAAETGELGGRDAGLCLALGEDGQLVGYGKGVGEGEGREREGYEGLHFIGLAVAWKQGLQMMRKDLLRKILGGSRWADAVWLERDELFDRGISRPLYNS